MWEPSAYDGSRSLRNMGPHYPWKGHRSEPMEQGAGLGARGGSWITAGESARKESPKEPAKKLTPVGGRVEKSTPRRPPACALLSLSLGVSHT